MRASAVVQAWRK